MGLAQHCGPRAGLLNPCVGGAKPTAPQKPSPRADLQCPLDTTMVWEPKACFRMPYGVGGSVCCGCGGRSKASAHVVAALVLLLGGVGGGGGVFVLPSPATGPR